MSKKPLKLSILDLPMRHDWREFNAVSFPERQGGCGSCWAFTAAGVIEGANKIAGNRLIPLSVQ